MRAVRLILTLWVLLWQSTPFFAQATDSLEVVKPPKIHRKKRKSKAQKALLMAIIPGGGQIYNKKYWKLPIVYGGLGLSIYNIQKNKREYKRFDQARTYRLDHNPNTVDTEFPNLTLDAINRIRQGYDKNVQLSYIMTGLVYSLSIMDAFVDAHLSEFDVGDDLSLKLTPSSMEGVGIGLVGVLVF